MDSFLYANSTMFTCVLIGLVISLIIVMALVGFIDYVKYKAFCKWGENQFGHFDKQVNAARQIWHITDNSKLEPLETTRNRKIKEK